MRNPLPGLIFIIVFVAGLGLAYANMSQTSTVASVSIAVLSFIVASIVASATKVADQWERVVVLRLGKFRSLEGPGLFFIVPIIETVPYRIDTRVITATFKAEETMTRDTVPVDVDAVLFWKVVDPKTAALDVADYGSAINWAAQTALRDVIGKTMLADMLEGREKLSVELQRIIDARAKPWGIDVIAVELKDVRIPAALQDAMSMQAQAERERQARVILGDSERQVADSFNAAAKAYADNPTAFHLRAMNMLYEGLKRSNATIVIVPSTAVESMQLGGMPTMATVASAVAHAQSAGRLESRRRRLQASEGEPSGGSQSVLNDPPVLHDDEEVLLRIGDELEVGGRVAVDDDEVGKGARLDHAELAWIRVARPGHRQEFAVDRGRHLEDFDGPIPALERRQDRALMHGHVRIEQDIRAPRRLDVERLDELVSRVRSSVDLLRFRLPVGRRHRIGIFIVEERLRAKPDPAPSDQFSGRLVHQVAMLDASGAASDRGAYCARRIGVHRDIGAPVFRGVDCGAELGFGILADVDRIVVRGHPAARGELELARSQHELLASALEHAIDAIGDGAAADRLHPAQRRTGGSGNLIGKAEVAMAAGLRNHRARRPDAGSRDETLIDRTLQAEGWAGHVANAGEAAHQRLSRFISRDQSDVANIRGQQDSDRQGRHHRVPVRIDEARHQNSAAAIHDARVGGERSFGRLDRLDPLALDDNPQALDERVRLAVEEPQVGERDGRN
jgi:regulator of protease activity HflC (stomatin/prohibitin superfamily)